MPSWMLSKYIKTKLQITCFYIIFGFFKKIKKGLRLVCPSSFSDNFWRKTFILICSINWPSFIVWLSLFREILGNMCIAFVSQVVTSWILMLTLPFYSSRFSHMTKKSLQKPKYLENEKSFLGEIKSIF